MRKSVTVNDKMQKGYRYELTEPEGDNFDPEFRPELTPQEMLSLVAALHTGCQEHEWDCRCRIIVT